MAIFGYSEVHTCLCVCVCVCVHVCAYVFLQDVYSITDRTHSESNALSTVQSKKETDG